MILFNVDKCCMDIITTDNVQSKGEDKHFTTHALTPPSVH